ncbi:MAG: flagellar export chaperone FliS [Planctomycetaceae bacterium]|nr:flagellar export chaperone FliS [Planctomycetaceae bacterium]
MEQPAHESYLEAQVMTATPQKLRLMLIEGAIRFARKTLRHWERGDNEQALETIIRCRTIVSELLASIRLDESELTKQVGGMYLFIFRHLTEAQLRRGAQHVEEAIRVLEAEQETWRLVCEQMPEAPPPLAQDPNASTEILAPQVVDFESGMTGGSFSLDA